MATYVQEDLTKNGTSQFPMLSQNPLQNGAWPVWEE